VTDLAGAAAVLGSHPFLVTVTPGGPHITVVAAEVGDAGIVLRGVGNRSTANLRANPAVTLLWQRPAEGERGLIVDGTAEVDGDTVIVSPTKAILHRPALDEHGIPAGSDCLSVDLGG
jgi:hypothetical protein